ncbi:hypothetical protein PRK78_002065 [Emydomyces testavorans]|uniref:Spindle pole body-associated protein cut12 domain-containing protein n=1 Tax=Emydomyces testavorans TaxID=2070801 RepID=A0AAF0DFN3_9EURO|nr:hypothetical protein PRK78_002065 [Emydomyces testavorans]
MLGWLAGMGRGESAGGVDAPETPAPVFAYKAFKNAVLGTPAEVDEDRELTVPIKPLNTTYQRSDELVKKLTKTQSEKEKMSQPEQPLPPPKEPTQPMPSPTKSILLTPGTAATRRKTVSFGEGVVDNERKRSASDASPRRDLLSGNISRQWPASISDPPKRSRNNLTPSFLEVRGNKSNRNDELFDIGEKKETTPTKKTVQAATQPTKGLVEEVEDDITTNLNEPRSQSGIYWKSEYESYRAKSDREFRKLIENRSLTDSFARMKEAEANRLADRLKQQEEKVKEMERCLTELAAGMAEKLNTGEPKNEDMVKELSQQTALTLKHKYKAASMRRALEKHGSLKNDDSPPDSESKQNAVALNLRKVQEELDRANAQLKAQGHLHDLEKLQELAQNSEQKASKLEAENISLKRDLAKVKKEILNYEERRKSKEAKLKRRHQVLESRVKEYSEQLRDTSKAHREAENALKKSFEAEKREMQEIIDSLRNKLAAGDKDACAKAHIPADSFRRSTRHSLAPSKREFDAIHGRKYKASHETGHNQATQTRNGPERGRSPLSQPYEHANQCIKQQCSGEEPRVHSTSETDVCNETGNLLELDSDLSPPDTVKRRQNNVDLLASANLLQTKRSRSESPKKPASREHYMNACPSPRPSMVYVELGQDSTGTSSRPHLPGNTEGKAPRQNANKASGLNRPLSLVPESSVPSSSASAKLKSMSPERAAAARARLRGSSSDAKRTRPQGKENVLVAI